MRHKGTYRILCLGESTTANQYPVFLEKTLNRRHTGLTFSIIDKGVVATDTPTILRRLKENLAVYRPDMVIAMMGVNDRRIAYCEDISDADTSLFQHYKTYRLVQWLYDRFSRKFHRTPPLQGERNRVYVGLGQRYRVQGRFSEAEASFKKAIELNPNDDKAYLEFGRYYRARGRFSEAEASFKKAIELNPNDDRACVDLGQHYRAQGRLSEAEALYNKTVEINPQNELAYIELGWIYRLQGKLSQAESVFKKGIELELPHNRVYDDRACVALSALYEAMGKPDLAKEYIEKAERLRSRTSSPITVHNYLKLKGILDQKGIRLVCMQYPMRSVEPLKNIFQNKERDVVFVDNEKLFKDAVEKDGYGTYFQDAFGGDFGHCTAKGNKLLAENIANVILTEVFH